MQKLALALFLKTATKGQARSQVKILRGNTFLGSQYFCFYFMFKINFSGHNKIWAHCLRMPPVAMGLLKGS